LIFVISNHENFKNILDIYIIITARIDVGEKGIDSATDIGQAQVEDAEIVSPPCAKIRKVENSESKRKFFFDKCTTDGE